MIVYIYSDMYFNKVNLPLKISGVYPLYINERIFLGNIEEKNGMWTYSPSDGVDFPSGELFVIKENTSFVLTDKITKFKYYIYFTKTYNEQVYRYNMLTDKFTIGYGSNCDICYSFDQIEKKDEIINIFVQNNKLYFKTDSRFTFINSKRKTEKVLYAGDYLFYYGLKIIFLGKEVIINGNNGQIKINPAALQVAQNSVEIVNEFDAKADEDVPLFNKQDYYFKAPRFYSKAETETVIINEPPAEEKLDDMPFVLVVGPQLTMLCTSGLSLVNVIDSYASGVADGKRFAISLAMTLITMTSALLWPTLTRRFNKKRLLKREEKRQKKYSDYLEKKKQEIALVKNRQKQALIDASPSLDNCKLIIETRPRTLWQKNVEHDDFLDVRLGIGNVYSKIRINYPEETFTLDEEDNLRTKLREIVNESLIINDVPLALNLVQNNKLGIIGDIKLSKQFVDNLFLQIMTFHAYTELKIIVYTKEKDRWDYLKILPHCWDNQKNIRYYATNLEEFNNIIADIDKTFDARVENDESVKLEDNGEEQTKTSYKDFKPYYLLFTDDINAIRHIPFVKKVLSYKKNLGFSIMMLHDRLSTLPSETATFINVEEQKCGLITNNLGKDNQLQFTAEYSNDIDIYECAQKLSNIPIMVEKAKYELPSSLPFLEMYGVGKVEQLNILDRWENNNPVNSLSVPIGVDQSGELFKMDIHEKAYGPHGLVAGTTGSGKSEWIVTYILSLAVNFHPDEVQFVLIDYKGGGLALSFENSELGIKLPHLAGTITNLDKSEIARAVSSLESELKRRQAMFNEAREKLKEGSMNIYKYQNFYRKKMLDKPLSHLLIICDEFAELKQQQPEFMDSLISISRIGRSLGVHLILATQKPSGVVNDQIWSNSKFKVCLKVQDRGESNEVLKKPDAAYLRQVGSFYLEVGNDEFYSLGQSAWAGAKYYPSNFLKKKVDQSVQSIDNVGKILNSYDLIEDDTPKENKGEQLINIVQYIDGLCKKEHITGSQLWLKNVEPISYLSNLVKKYKHTFSQFKYNIAIGEYDEPRRQEQGLLEVDISKGNIAIMGQPGSGKENLISTLMWSSMIEHTPQELNFYVIDYGAETLKKFAKFPHVGEVLFQSEADKVVELLQMMFEELEKRKTLFSDYNGSFEYYNKMSGKPLPLIVLVVNAYDVFLEGMGKLEGVFDSLFRDAPRYGIELIITTSSTSTLRSRQLQYFNHTIMMQIQDESLYRGITNCRKGLIPAKVFGRGICKIGLEDDSYCEFQTALIAPDEIVYEFIKTTANKLNDYYKVKAKQLVKIPENVTSEDLAKYVDTLGNVPIGYNFYEKDIAKYDFLSEKVHIITGKDIASNINFIYGLANMFLKHKGTQVRIFDISQIFKKPMMDIKLYSENFDVMFAALENDVLTRKDNQDMGINIIIGVGGFKKALSEPGLEIFNNLFNNIVNSKKNIFILIDNYDKLRMRKMEPWYHIINTTRGIWLGPGFDSQSMISSNEVSLEDKKYKFEGLGFMVDDANYTVIKTMLDGDD